MGITAKTGDDGYTDLLDGKRLRKDHPLIECLGTLDELNAFLGDAKAALGVCPSSDIISGIQKDLSSIMGALAGGSVPAVSVPALESSLPPLTAFAVPGENAASAKLHIARAVCRRAERRLTALGLTNETKAVLPYINRLSNLLFLLARKVV
ncbi:MAG: cob(I)yrinic acid a,c-diamide adenosyltransferase [Treponema sp.]|jgi:cob(I)alamin adenosyltransferase|nr:cob(I)yrinic acid a,c-diamide adenosyltransferase [Treponema sp.]